MTKPENDKSVTSTPVVEDPHPGSISDGTHPEAKEHKPPRSEKRDDAGPHGSERALKPDVKESQTDINREAPRHPNKGAYGS
ncbi:hypothetical protein J2Y63_002909 [Shinella sp. BE166]|uniref:hypothetical protein n=1 Tax=Shinella sp. BE166 TaxID=3373918 RepID=UPI003EB80FBA